MLYVHVIIMCIVTYVNPVCPLNGVKMITDEQIGTFVVNGLDVLWTLIDDTCM